MPLVPRAARGRARRLGPGLLGALCILGSPACGPAPSLIDGGNFEDEGGEAPEIECALSPGEHNPAQPNAGAILGDLELRCDDPMFSHLGFEVAASPGGPLLLTSGTHGGLLLRPGDDPSAEGSEIPGYVVERLPEWLGDQHPLLALDSAGEPMIVGHRPLEADANSEPESEPEPFELVSLQPRDSLAASPGEWREAQVLADAGAPGLLELLFDPQGKPHLWYAIADQGGPRHLIREQPGSWTAGIYHPPGHQSTDAGVRFAISSDGEVHAFGMNEGDGNYLWLRRVGDGAGEELTSDLLVSTSFETIADVRVVGGPRPGYASVEIEDEYGGEGVAYQRFSALLGEAYGSLVFIHETPYGPSADYLPVFGLDPWCDLEPEDCAGSCPEHGQGLLPRQFDLARTNDGRDWVAWVHTRYDREYVFDEHCHPNVCFCQVYLIEDASTAQLRIGRVSNEAVHVVAQFELGSTLLDQGQVQALGERVASVSAHGFGDRLVVAARVRDGRTPRSLDAALRVVELDTSLIPEP